MRELGLIGALEIRVVQQGTSDSLIDFFISLGASIAQYKTPCCINSSEALAVLENRVLAQVFDKCPRLIYLSIYNNKVNLPLSTSVHVII
ncbi:hypothetical protein HID58_079437 [Brassica napus]|uniref:GH3 C-terminal domain-containing protein n=1 Tax=Brassica napus TaxID=3708 RepID=A0ABQ7Y4R4_BRANA|nr:hypothetical protein HID58_079437 [Brassica napus]